MNNVVKAKEFVALTDIEQGGYLFFDENYSGIEVKQSGKGKCECCDREVDRTYVIKEEGVTKLCIYCFIEEFKGGVFVKEEFTERERQSISALLSYHQGSDNPICSEEELQTLIDKV